MQDAEQSGQVGQTGTAVPAGQAPPPPTMPPTPQPPAMAAALAADAQRTAADLVAGATQVATTVAQDAQAVAGTIVKDAQQVAGQVVAAAETVGADAHKLAAEALVVALKGLPGIPEAIHGLIAGNTVAEVQASLATAQKFYQQAQGDLLARLGVQVPGAQGGNAPAVVPSDPFGMIQAGYQQKSAK